MAVRIRPSDEVVQTNIKKWGIPQPEKEYTVVIHCTTYNHGKYIKNALEGFVMQKCSYSFCAIIIDDCSTDNNAEIIKEYAEKYPDIIKPILLGENHMQRSILRDPYFERWHQSAKYIAQCEGDDYWTDPMKLQKQVAFLESHPEYSMCFGDVVYYNSDTKKEKGRISLISRKPNLKLNALQREALFKQILLGGCYIQTLSVLYRFDCMQYIPKNNTSFLMGDTPLWLDLSQLGKIKYFDEIMGVYNIHQGSSTHTDLKKRLRFDLSIEEMRVYYCRKYNYDIPVIVKRKYNKAYITLLASGIEFQALYEPFVENKLQMWQIRQLRKKTWYFNVYNKLIHPIWKKVDYISIKANIAWSIIWNRI